MNGSSADFSDWWHEVGSAALVGTGRRPVPPLPHLGVTVAARADGRPEEALLTAAALGGAVLRSGRVPDTGSVPAPAPSDSKPSAPARAIQLLELVLTQPPAGAQQRPLLLQHWMTAAATAGYRLPHALLPTVLESAGTNTDLRRVVVKVLDARGAWLASQRPDWQWAAEPSDAIARATGHISADDWARLTASDRVATLSVLRAHDPDTARSLVESTWSSDSAKDRRAHLETLVIALAPDDEPLLERALDDRAASVREVAWVLLDALPGSARAARMADRLRPLIESKGLLRRHLEVRLPDDPDPAGQRDGLGKPPPRRSARGWWLEQLAAGAPLQVWTDASGSDPATAVARLTDEDALRGIRRAASARRDGEWALALLARAWDPTLLEALPRAEREQAVLSRLGEARPAHEVMGLIAAMPGPWTGDFSARVVGRLRTVKAPALVVGQSMPHLVAGLHPQALPALEDWLADARSDTALATHLRNLLQFHTVKRSISEAFT